MKILPTITTITPGKWRDKIAEVKKFKLKEVAVFPTCLNREARKEFFSLLKETVVKRIPFVHLRSDISLEEIDYLVRVYKTEAFNIHTKREYPSLQDCGPYRKIIYIENTYEPFDEEEIKEFGGICLDFSHLENDRLFRRKVYEHNIKVIKKYPCGCNHVGPAKDFACLDRELGNIDNQRPHFLKKLSELDYLKRYPSSYFSPLTALELENSIEEQLEVKKYISALVKNKYEN